MAFAAELESHIVEMRNLAEVLRTRFKETGNPETVENITKARNIAEQLEDLELSLESEGMTQEQTGYELRKTKQLLKKLQADYRELVQKRMSAAECPQCGWKFKA